MIVLSREQVEYNGVTVEVELRPMLFSFIAEQADPAAAQALFKEGVRFEAGDLIRTDPSRVTGPGTGRALLRKAVRRLLVLTSGRPFAFSCTHRHGRAYNRVVCSSFWNDKEYQVRSDRDRIVVVRGDSPRGLRPSVEV